MSQTSEFLRRSESEWAPSLRAVSLVSAVDAPEDQVKEVIRALGQVCVDADLYDRRRLLTYRYPACLVIGLAGIGAVGYEHGNYWSAVHQLAPNRVDQSLWGEVFRTNLDRFDLVRFPGLPQVNVSEILMHAGVPAYCIGDLLALLLHRQARDPGLSGQHFMAWALTPGRESRLHGMDKPCSDSSSTAATTPRTSSTAASTSWIGCGSRCSTPTGSDFPHTWSLRAQDLVEAGTLDWTGTADRTESTARSRRRALIGT